MIKAKNGLMGSRRSLFKTLVVILSAMVFVLFTAVLAFGQCIGTISDPSPASASYASSAGSGFGFFTVSISPANCGWGQTGSTSTWITNIDSTLDPNTGTGDVTFSVAPNTGPARQGTITLGPPLSPLFTFPVYQLGVSDPCPYTVDPLTASYFEDGGTGSFDVGTAYDGCTPPGLSPFPDWIQLTSEATSIAYGRGPSVSYNYTVLSNTGSPRVGYITVGDQTITITQQGPGIEPLLTLDVTGAAYGDVVNLPSEDFCPGSSNMIPGTITCERNYLQGEQVTLTATPAFSEITGLPISTFVGWSGACFGKDECVVTMDANKYVGAEFVSVSATPAITSLNPSSTTAGSADFLLIVDGANFTPSSVAKWNTSNRPTTFESKTRLIAQISAPDVASPGAPNVTVDSSLPETFTVSSPPATVSIQPPPPFILGNPYPVTVTFQNTTGSPINTIRLDCCNTTLNLRDSNNQTVLNRDAICRPYVIGCPGEGQDPGDVVTIPANGQVDVTCDLSVIYPLLPAGSYSLSAILSRNFQDPYIIDGQCKDPDPACGCFDLWTGTLDSTGNISINVSKTYKFYGFFSPVDNLPVTNVAKAGQTIPVKFRITDANDVPITNSASFSDPILTTASCQQGSLSGPTDPIDQYTSGSSGLQNLGNGNWQYNWKTPKSFAGQCIVMHLNLNDETALSARFQFK